MDKEKWKEEEEEEEEEEEVEEEDGCLERNFTTQR